MKQEAIVPCSHVVSDPVDL